MKDLTNWREITEKRGENKLEEETRKMDNKIDDFDRALHRPEQYSRGNYILVHGVKKSENENIGSELFIKI